MTDSAVEMAKRLVVDSIWKSANLEGLGTTFPKTEAILLNIPTSTKTEEVFFVVNMKRAWKFLLDNLDYPNSLMLLREFNKIIDNDLFSSNNAIWAPDIPDQTVIMTSINTINNVSDVELMALKYFCFVIRTKMFIVGNERIAQLIANKVLIQNNRGIFQIDVDFIEEFKTLLFNFYETNDDTRIINFMMKNCIKKVQSSDLRLDILGA